MRTRGLPLLSVLLVLWAAPAQQPAPRLLADIRSGPLNSMPDSFVSTGRTTLLLADDGSRGREPWITNGEIGGTFFLADLVPGPIGGANSGGTAAAATVFYMVQGRSGLGLWVSDGTVAGTRRLAAFAGIGFLSPAALGFVSNGNASGTVPIRPMSLGQEPTTHAPYATLHELSDDRALLNVYTPAGSFELWETDGTPAGTVRVLASWFLEEVHANAGRLLLGLGGASGVEPHALELGALAHPTGPGCGQGIRAPALNGTTPRLGTIMSLRGSQGGPGVAILAVGTVPGRSTLVGGNCVLGLDPGTAVPLAAAVGPSWVIPLPVPNLPGLSGLLLGAQALLLNPANPRGFELSNALHLRLGM